MKHKIDEELVSVDALKYVLCTRCDCEVGRIHREEDDPPDFSVIIDDENYSVEVTSIVSEQQYHEHCNEFVEVIRRNAISSGTLSGKYTLVIFGLPTIPKPNSQDGRNLLNAALSYIQATKQQDVSPKVELVSEASGKIEIQKISGINATVGLLWTPPGKWGIDIQNQVTGLIQKAVDDKIRKLQAKRIIDGDKAVLLLYDAYGYADHDDVRLAFQQVTGYDWFHSIFWALVFSDRENQSFSNEPGRDGFFLYSRDRKWSDN